MRHAVRVLVPALLLAVCSAAPLRAQDHGAACGAPALAALSFLEGEWSVEANNRLSPAPDDWEKTTATSRVERAMLGCILIERFAGTRRGGPFESVRMFAAKPEARLQLAITDSAHGPIYLYEGRVETEGPAFSMSLDTPNGPVLVGFCYRDIAKNSFTAETRRSVDGGKSWDTTSVARYQRR